MTMKNMQLTLSKNLLKRDYKWLYRDFKKGEQLYLLMGSTEGCVGKNGITCCTNDNASFVELPITTLTIQHENKEFGIFMTELGKGYQLFYCKEFPFDSMELLTKMQSNVHLLDSKKPKPVYKMENQIFKVNIKNGKITYKMGHLEDVAPLF